MQQKGFFRHKPSRMSKKERDVALTTSHSKSTFCRENLSLAGCSSAEPASVSVQQCKLKRPSVHLQLHLTGVVLRSIQVSSKNGQPYSGMHILIHRLLITDPRPPSYTSPHSPPSKPHSTQTPSLHNTSTVAEATHPST